MESTTAAVPADPPKPIPVEESRAQRLQRQQARFRDRGGIFVPSNRNTLIDILLGRKQQSPLKRRSRSLSCSPVKNKPKGFTVGGQKTETTALSSRRTSPRKKTSKKQVDEGASEPIASPSKVMGLEAHSKPAKKSRKVKEKADKPPATPKRRGRPPKAKADKETIASETSVPVTGKEIDPDLKPKGRKRAPATSKKPAAKKGQPRKKVGLEQLEVEEDVDEADEAAAEDLSTPKSIAPMDKSKSKGKKTLPSSLVHESGVEPAEQTPKRVARLGRPNVELSDDDVIPVLGDPSPKNLEKDPLAIKKPPDGKSKEPKQLQSIEEDNIPQLSENVDLTEPRISKKRVRPQIHHKNDVLGNDNDHGARKRARAEPQSSKESSDHVARKPRTKKPQGASETQRKAASHDHETSDNNETMPTKQARAQPKPKRVKDVEPVTNKSHSANPNNEVGDQSQKEPDVPLENLEPQPLDKVSVPKKRSLETVSGGSKKAPTKRKKVNSAEKSQDTSHQHDDPKASHSKEGSQSSLAVRASRDLKENLIRTKAPKVAPKPDKVLAKSIPVAVPRRPRKSVLQRIKEPRPQIEDDDPDPIDFLS